MHQLLPGTAVLISVIALAGCAVLDPEDPLVFDNPPQADPSIHFDIIDSRPESDSKGQLLTDLRHDCNVGVFRIGDARMRPRRLELLHSDLVNILGDRLHGKSVEVTRYGVYLNRAALWNSNHYAPATRGASSQTYTPVMGSICKPEQMHGGYYSRAEVTNLFSPVVIEIEAIFNGRTISVRTVHSPPRELGTKELKNPADAREYFLAMRRASFQLAVAMFNGTSG